MTDDIAGMSSSLQIALRLSPLDRRRQISSAICCVKMDGRPAAIWEHHTMSADGKMTKDQFAEWLVPSRSKIQDELLELRRAFQRRGDLVDSPEARVLALLVGVGFSLWRAVFIAEEGLDPDLNLVRARSFLDKVIFDNAIAFKDDKNSWSFGYYLNNSRYRLIRAYTLIEKDKRHADLGTQIAKVRPHIREMALNGVEVWENCLAAMSGLRKAVS